MAQSADEIATELARLRARRPRSINHQLLPNCDIPCSTGSYSPQDRPEVNRVANRRSGPGAVRNLANRIGNQE